VGNIKILHANSNTLVRAGLRALLKKGGGVDQLWEVEDNEDLYLVLQKKTPDLLIIDHDQPGMFSKKDILKVRKKFPDLKVLIISNDEKHLQILSLIETGVQGYLTRECDEDEVVSAVFSVASGDNFYCNKVLNVIMEKELAPDAPENCEPTSLSQRENEIASLIAQGKTNKEVASELYLSPHTVNTHRKNIMKKLGCNSAQGIVLYAINAGLLVQN
jgi:DNA-binding NarL/FixJ family response regulator